VPRRGEEKKKKEKGEKREKRAWEFGHLMSAEFFGKEVGNGEGRERKGGARIGPSRRSCCGGRRRERESFLEAASRFTAGKGGSRASCLAAKAKKEGMGRFCFLIFSLLKEKKRLGWGNWVVFSSSANRGGRSRTSPLPLFEGGREKKEKKKKEKEKKKKKGPGRAAVCTRAQQGKGGKKGKGKLLLRSFPSRFACLGKEKKRPEKPSAAQERVGVGGKKKRRGEKKQPSGRTAHENRRTVFA